MKLKIFTATAVIITASWAIQTSFNELNSKPDGAPSGVTGSPGDGGNTCAKSGCHTNVPVKTKSGLITSNIPSTGYIPGTTYTINVKGKSTNVNRWGFELSPQNITTGALMGQLIVTNTSQTKLVGSGKYITHTQAGNSGAGLKKWTFNWKAPLVGSGKVKFYATILFANNNGGTSGDTTYKTSMLKYEDTIPAIQDPNRIGALSDGSMCPASLQASIFPNPFSSSSKIQLKGISEEDYSYQVFSATGEVVKTQDNIESSTITQFGDDMKPGIYFVRITQGDHTKTMKIVKTQ